MKCLKLVVLIALWLVLLIGYRLIIDYRGHETVSSSQSRGAFFLCLRRQSSIFL